MERIQWNGIEIRIENKREEDSVASTQPRLGLG